MKLSSFRWLPTPEISPVHSACHMSGATCLSAWCQLTDVWYPWLCHTNHLRKHEPRFSLCPSHRCLWFPGPFTSWPAVPEEAPQAVPQLLCRSYLYLSHAKQLVKNSSLCFLISAFQISIWTENTDSLRFLTEYLHRSFTSRSFP